MSVQISHSTKENRKIATLTPRKSPIMKLSIFTFTLHFLHFTNLNVVALPVRPTVNIKNGTIIGSSLLDVETFKGIPYAQPPVNELRLKPPQPLQSPFGDLDASKNPAQCPQFNGMGAVSVSSLPATTGIDASRILDAATQTSANGQEDCLTLNIQRPSSANIASKFPVVVWIHGGGFTFGSTQIYDATDLINTAASLGTPIIFVAMNYRVGGFGFLAGKEVQADGSTNLGLRDQRKALQWVQENIEAFGGDPDKVTIWGESAGSASVLDHLLINRGDNSYRGRKLFRGAIMNSGSVFNSLDVTSTKPQAVYDSIVAATGCSSSRDTLTCLRQVPFNKLYPAMNANFGNALINANYFPRPDPSSDFLPQSQDEAIISGETTKVPFIIGNQEDEGTLFTFSRQNISTPDDVVDTLAAGFPTTPRSLVEDLVAAYPSDVTAGSPFNTGTLNEVYPQYKRIAAIFGDISFTMTRRFLLSIMSSQVPTWSYLSTYYYGSPVLGTFHATDILALYFGVAPPTPTQNIKTYYASFIATLDPNQLAKKMSLPTWPQYKPAELKMLQFNALNTVTVADTFRNTAYQFFAQKISQFKI